MPRLGIDTFARVHKLATRSMQQRCIPRTFASVFSRGCNRHTDVGKRVANVGVHSILRIIFSLPFLFRSLLSLSLSLSLCFSFSLNSHSCVSISLQFIVQLEVRRTPSLPLFFPLFFLFHTTRRPVIVDTTDQNGCFTPPLARELGNKLAAGLISLSRSERGTLPLETSRDRCPEASNRCLDMGGTVFRTQGSMALRALSTSCPSCFSQRVYLCQIGERCVR